MLTYRALEYAANKALNDKQYDIACEFFKELISKAESDIFFKRQIKIVYWKADLEKCLKSMSLKK